MSHIATCKAELRSLEIIERAARRLGGALIRNQKEYKWFGRTYGNASSDGKCDHAIRFPKARYEVGVREKKTGGYELAYDSYAAGGLLPYIGDDQAGLFVQAYGIEAAKQAALRRGYLTRETTLPDGKVELSLMVR